MTATSVLTKITLAALGLLLAGCALSGPDRIDGSKISSSTEATSCRSVRFGVGDAVARFQVRDVQARQVAGVPYLRINRFLAHLRVRFAKQQSGIAFRVWVKRLRALDDQAVRIELANLPRSELDRLARQFFKVRTSREQIIDAYNTCARAFVAELLADRDQRRQLVQAARVSDDYSDVAQLTGLFPLTSIPIATGWKQWKKKHLVSFERPVADLPVRGKIVEWSPEQSSEVISSRAVRKIVERSRDSVLGIPKPKGRDLQRLLNAFAPIWQVDVTGAYDRIGHPSWHNDGSSIFVDRRRPVVFTRTSHAIVDGQILLQLVYSVWFQERPRRGALDLLGGHLDGVVWRVTLASNGQPLMYDSIHACGCYHFLFPLKAGGAASWQGRTRSLKEVPAIITGTQVPQAGQRVLLRLAAETHYLLGIAVAGSRSQREVRNAYRLIDEDVLRSLPLSSHRRLSLFGTDGIVAGTERLERFLLWPTGVKSPGAVRQWGHHAIAFAERRHFDDPVLFDRVFKK